MKTWLILIYLAVAVIPSLSRMEVYDRTNEAGTPLPIQDSKTEKAEEERIQTPHSQDSEKGILTWISSLFKKKPDRTEDPEHQRAMNTKDSKKGMWERVWSFVRKDSSESKNMEDETLLSSQAPWTENQWNKWDLLTLNIQPMKFLKFVISKEDAPTNIDLKSINRTGDETKTEEMHPLSPHHSHPTPLNSQYTSANFRIPQKEGGAEGKLEEAEEDDKFTDANEEMGISEDDCKGCLTATKPPPRDSITGKLLPITEKTTTPTVPPRRNPWATCNHSTPEMEEVVAAALSKFAVNIYKKATESEKDSNIVFSPISIAVMLSNLLLGACDETKVRLEQLLSYPEDVTCVHAALKKLQKSEALASASAIFYQPTLTLNDEFRTLSDKFYQSWIRHLSNDSHQDVTDINAWVSKKTNHKIKKLLDDLDPDVQMVLLNAVSLRAKWKLLFRKNAIKEEEFYLPGHRSISVPMLTSKKYPVASFVDSSLQAKVGRLQLSHNMSMIIIMPLSLSQNLSEVERRLDADVLMAIMSKLESMPFRPTILTLPKFKVASSQDLISIVHRLDYGIFYDANLCGISEDEEVAVTSAQHRAVLEINEEGVEAAAATVITLARTANFFSVTQPFIFMVSKNNEFPVFLGRIHNPEAS